MTMFPCPIFLQLIPHLFISIARFVKAGHSERMKKHVLTPPRLNGWERLRVSWTAKKTNEWVLNKAGVKRELLDTGEKYNARNNARCTQARKTMHSLDGRHQYVDRTIRGKVNQNNRDKWEKVRPWCGQPSDRGRLKNRTEPSSNLYFNGCL